MTKLAIKRKMSFRGITFRALSSWLTDWADAHLFKIDPKFSVARRALICGGLGLAASQWLIPVSSFVAQARPMRGGVGVGGGGSGLMSAVVTIGGTPYTYTEASGASLGTYHGQTFSCTVTKGYSASPAPNYGVWFVQDIGTTRQEAWLKNYSSGDLTSLSKPIAPANTATNLSSHTVQIFVGGVLQTGGYIGQTPVASSPAWSAGTITGPDHWFAAEWRWQSTPRPVINSPATIMANGWMVNYGFTGMSAGLRAYDNSDQFYASPMDTAGILKFMGTAGNQRDVGLVPQWTATWLLDPSGNRGQPNEYAMLSAGEGAHSIPQCFTNDATNAPINFATYPQANNFVHSGSYVGGSPAVILPANEITTNPSGWTPDNAHFPANSYIPFCATGGDPWFLLGTIFEITCTLMQLGITDGTYPMVDPEQDRAYAWGYRSKAMAWAALKIAESWGALPSFIGTSSAEWKNFTQAEVDIYYNYYSNNTTTNYSHQFGSGTLLAGQETWETEYETMAMFFHKKVATALSTTFTNLAANCTYRGKSSIDRTSGLSGWKQAFPVPYAWNWIQPGFFTGQYTTPPGGIAQMYYAPDWATAWQYFWQGQTAELFGYIDVPNLQLVVTAMNNGARAYNQMNCNSENNGASWMLETDVLLPDAPLGAFGVQTRLSGSVGGPGTFSLSVDQRWGGSNSWDIPTASPCNVSLGGGGIDPGLAVNQKFCFYTGGLKTFPTITSSSASTALPPGGTLTITNAGVVTAFYTLSIGAGSAAITDTSIAAGATAVVTVGANTFINAITASGTTSFRMAIGTLPAPLSTTKDYFVTSRNAPGHPNSFQFSDTLGGTPINVTGARTDSVFIVPYVGTSGSPAAMSVGNGGNSMCMKTVNALAADQTNGGHFAQGGQDEEYLTITQAAVALAKADGQSGSTLSFSNCNTMTGNLGNCIEPRWAMQPS